MLIYLPQYLSRTPTASVPPRSRDDELKKILVTYSGKYNIYTPKMSRQFYGDRLD